MRLAEVANLIGVEIAADLAAQVPIGYSIDSRTIKPGELFFAIKGEQFDGHNFVANALKAGAVAAIVSRPMEGVERDNQRLITVADTLVSLQKLASGVLAGWQRPVIGITGSAGKTTTKELTALVLEAKGKVHRSVGNFNNAYGLPLSVLEMESRGATVQDYDFAVLEMGMSTPGEIRRLTQIAPPAVGAVTNVSAVHLEFFDSIDGIANAKAELIEGIQPGGLAVLNADDPRVAAMRTRHNGPVKTFGLEQPADVQAQDIRANGLLGSDFRLVTQRGETEVKLPLAGRHIIYNALVAAAIGDHFGLSLTAIADQLAKARPAYHRGEVLKFKNSITVVDDSYNSNPRALDEMVRMLAQVPGVKRRIVVTGEMLELGPAGVQMHRDCGAEIARNQIDLLVGVRGLAEEIINGARAAGLPEERTRFFAASSEVAGWLSEQLQAGDIVLIKGSRGVKTELVVAALKERFELEEA